MIAKTTDGEDEGRERAQTAQDNDSAVPLTKNGTQVALKPEFFRPVRFACKIAGKPSGSPAIRSKT